MQTFAGETKGRGISIRQVAFASFVGTTTEYYDFFAYGTAAALVFPSLFFPTFSPLAGTLASFATFGVAFLARPIGGIAFGHFGDKVGRKSTLVATLLLMGSATFLVGLLPTFKTVGVLAPILLVALRFLQGVAVGGEWGGATLMTVEHAPEESRNFYASWPQLGIPAGLMLSTAIFGFASSLTNQRFLSWGWRIPFLLSIILISIGLFIRMRLPESPVFSKIKALGQEAKYPLVDLLRDYPAATMLAIGVTIVNFGPFYVVTTFTLSYITGRFGLPRNVALVGDLLFSATGFAGILIFALVADRIGKRPLALWSSLGLVVLSYPFFWLIDTGRPMWIWLAMIVWEIPGAAFYAVTGVFMAEFFETRVRYSGISFGYQMAGMLAGAPAPIISAALVHWAGGASWPVATFVLVNCLVTFISVCLASVICKTFITGPQFAQPQLADH